MNFGQFKIDNPLNIEKTPEEEEKMNKIENIRNNLDDWRDGLNKGIDEGIKNTVAYLNVLDFHTSQSCEGHIDGGVPTPWIAIESSSEPEERFIEEEEIFRNVAKEHGISLDQIKIADNMDAYWEAINKCKQNGETEDFKEWREKNKKLQGKMKLLLDEFYEDRSVEENVKIIIEENADSNFNIRCNMNNGEYDSFIKPNNQEMTEEKKKRFTLELERYRAEMDEFTEFLKKKYFEE